MFRKKVRSSKMIVFKGAAKSGIFSQNWRILEMDIRTLASKKRLEKFDKVVQIGTKCN
jgi:hypothetical protein